MTTLNFFFSANRYSLLFFLCSWIFIFCIYFPGHRAMLIDDGVSGLWDFETDGFQGYLNSYGMKSFYHGYFAFLYFIYFLFGTHPLGWFFVFSFLHAFNATFIFTTFRKIYTQLTVQNAFAISLIGAILFLVSPYQSENIIWGATGHYALTLLVLLFGLNFIADFSKNKMSFWAIAFFHLFFLFGLFTLEISFFFLPIWSLLALLFYFQKRHSFPLVAYVYNVFLPQIILIGFYLLLYHYKNGIWIPNRHLEATQFQISTLITTLAQQVLKLFSFLAYTDYNTKDFYYTFCTHWKKAGFIIILLVSFFILFLYKKQRNAIGIFLFLLTSSGLILFPFLQSYFMYLFKIENDRYLYFGTAFLLQAFVLVIFNFPNYLKIALLGFYLVAFIYFIFPNVKARKVCAKLYYNYIQTFPNQEKGKIFLLNVPNYCADAYVFRADERLHVSMLAEFRKDISKQTIQVAYYNAISDKDSFEVKRLNDTTCIVKILTNGRWWMKENKGLSNYENEYYKLERDEYAGYTLLFKKKLSLEDKMYIYSKGNFRQIK